LHYFLGVPNDLDRLLTESIRAVAAVGQIAVVIDSVTAVPNLSTPEIGS
jgi:hypothetical protein